MNSLVETHAGLVWWTTIVETHLIIDQLQPTTFFIFIGFRYIVIAYGLQRTAILAGGRPRMPSNSVILTENNFKANLDLVRELRHNDLSKKYYKDINLYM